MTTQNQRFQDLVNECNNFPQPGIPEYEVLVTTLWTIVFPTPEKTYTLGYLTPAVSSALQSLPTALAPLVLIDPQHRTISLTSTTRESRTRSLELIVNSWKDSNVFDLRKKWRGEETPIYAPSGVIWATIERAATPLFGFTAYYVYLIAYTMVENEMKVWVQRRDVSKSSYGGMLDGTVAGAITAGTTPFESVVREALEEASLSASVVARARPFKYASSGTDRVLNMNIVASGGEQYYRPGCGFGFEVELERGEKPVPSDGEVADFYCLGVDEMLERLKKGEFMPNAAKVLVEWLVGKGMLEGVDIPTRKLDIPLM